MCCKFRVQTYLGNKGSDGNHGKAPVVQLPRLRSQRISISVLHTHGSATIEPAQQLCKLTF